MFSCGQQDLRNILQHCILRLISARFQTKTALIRHLFPFMRTTLLAHTPCWEGIKKCKKEYLRKKRAQLVYNDEIAALALLDAVKLTAAAEYILISLCDNMK